MSERTKVLFLPGLLCDERLWRDQVAALSEFADCQVADLTLDDNIADMARRALATVSTHFALVGLSMGGYVAFEIFRQAPERISQLALFATSAVPDSPERAAQRRAGMESLKHGRFRGVTNLLLRQLIHPDKVAREIGLEVRAMAERVGAGAFLRQQTAILGRPDSRPTLARVKVPTLVAVGDSDLLTPLPHSEEIQRAIPGSQLHVFKRCGHLPAMEAPEETTDLLRRFLVGLTPLTGA